MASLAFSLSSIAKAKRRTRRSAPADPPMGTYDPTIDSQGRQNQRSYDDTLQSFGIGKQRAEDDLQIGLGNLDTSRSQATEDLTTSRTRNLADLLTGRQRAGEDHAAAVAALGHRYEVLANQQGQRARQANVESGGILAQALAKRQANQALEQQPLDQSYGRSMDDSAQQQQRLEEDFGRAGTRLASDATQRSDALKLAFDRAFGPNGDNVVNLSRAGRDLTAGQLDLNAQRWYSATANGYLPAPRIPKRKTRRQVIV